MKKTFQVAIDGPVAAGKGTVSRLLAERLHFLYIDTGAMYRTTALLALRNHVPFSDEEQLTRLIEAAHFDMHNPESEKEQDGRLITMILNSEDISWEIRTPLVSDGASKVATLAKIRQALVKKQQTIADSHDVVMEGRDITFRVLPDADLKIFLTADLSTRAERRHTQYLTQGQNKTLEEVIQEIQKRDDTDMHREVDPLQITDDAWILDTSHLAIDTVVETIAQRVTELQRTRRN